MILTLKELKERFEKASFNYAYGGFKKAVSLPHFVAKSLETENIMADDEVYFSLIPIKLDYTYEEKNIEEQKKIEQEVLKGVTWNKSDETYLQDEEVWQVSYFFEILN